MTPLILSGALRAAIRMGFALRESPFEPPPQAVT